MNAGSSPAPRSCWLLGNCTEQFPLLEPEGLQTQMLGYDHITASALNSMILTLPRAKLTERPSQRLLSHHPLHLPHPSFQPQQEGNLDQALAARWALLTSGLFFSATQGWGAGGGSCYDPHFLNEKKVVFDVDYFQSRY